MSDTEAQLLTTAAAAADAPVELSAARAWSWPHTVAVPVVAYVLVTWLTNAFYMGDTSFYGALVAQVVGGESYQLWEASGNYSLWDFGHLLWRPLGVAAFPLLSPLAHLSVGSDLIPGAGFVLVALNWPSGLLSVVVMHALLRRVSFGNSRLLVHFITVAFVFSQAFLNYTQTGCSYVPGLAFLLLGFFLLVRDGERVESSLRTALLAGLAFTVSVALWVPYLWAVPAAVAAPVLLYGWKDQKGWKSYKDWKSQKQLRLSLYAGLAFGLLTGMLFIAVAIGIGIYSVGGFRAWVQSSAHHIEVRGLPQVVFGLARSFISMGSDNIAFKRYLLHDPYSPVSLVDLLRLSLWKLTLFYLFLAAILINLWRSSFGRRLLLVVALSGLPVLGFALSWNGSVMERYLPWVPFLFPAIAYTLSERRAFLLGKAITVAFLLAMIIANFSAMRNTALDRREEASAVRVRELQPLIKPQGIVLVGKDELENFVRDFPFNPVNYHNDLRVHSFLPLGMPQLPHWRQDVAQRSFKAWREGGDVFVSRRMFAERPRPEWDWVEGADPRLRWTEVYEYFSQLETGAVLGGEDGFVLLPRTPKNEQFLSQFAAPETTTHDRAMSVR